MAATETSPGGDIYRLGADVVDLSLTKLTTLPVRDYADGDSFEGNVRCFSYHSPSLVKAILYQPHQLPNRMRACNIGCAWIDWFTGHTHIVNNSAQNAVQQPEHAAAHSILSKREGRCIV